MKRTRKEKDRNDQAEWQGLCAPLLGLGDGTGLRHGLLIGRCGRLNIPANVPAKDFWSFVVYDPQTRSELQTSQPFPSKNNKRDNLIVNADGSVDLYVGPEAPAGKEANWVQSVPGKGWFALFRLYGPLEPWFDKRWRPGEIEEVK